MFDDVVINKGVKVIAYGPPDYVRTWLADNAESPGVHDMRVVIGDTMTVVGTDEYMMSTPATSEEASPEHPIYKKVRINLSRNPFVITCDEGWRTMIVFDGLYEALADWLIYILGRTPFAKRS